MFLKASEVKELLNPFKSRELHGVEGLVEAANEFLGGFKTGRADDSIEEFNIRTVRYYLSDQSGPLLKAPNEKVGQMLLFRYPDLISLIAIKWFQKQNLQLSLIKAAMSEMTVAQLEKAIGEPIKVFTNRTQLDSFVKSSGEKLEDNYVELRDPVARKEFLDDQKKRKETSTSDLWKRIELDHGLELNIASSFKKSLTREEENALVEKFKKAISDK